MRVLNHMFDKYFPPLFSIVIAMVMACSVCAQETITEGTNDIVERYLSSRQNAWKGPTKIISSADQATLSNIVEEAKAINPNSFEYHYLAYLDQPYSESSATHLAAAKQLNPNYPGLHQSVIQDAHFRGHTDLLREAVTAFNAKAAAWSNKELRYHQDVLNSLPQNAIIITNGDNDTHPLLVLQYAHGIRKDVQVIRADFLQQATFLQRTPLPQSVQKKLVSSNRRDAVLLAFNAFPAQQIHLALTLPSSWLQLAPDAVIAGLALGKANSTHTIHDLVARTAQIDPANVVPSSKVAHLYDKNYLPLFLILEQYHIDTSTGADRKYTEAIARIKAKLKNPGVIDNLQR